MAPSWSPAGRKRTSSPLGRKGSKDNATQKGKEASSPTSPQSAGSPGGKDRFISTLSTGSASGPTPANAKAAAPPPQVVEVVRGSFFSESNQSLTGHFTVPATGTVEELFAAGLLQADKHNLLVVAHSEAISSVIENLHHRKLNSCIVTLASGQQESFDLMDFACYLLDVVLVPSTEDWEGTKRKLRKAATEPVRKALRSAAARRSAPLRSPGRACERSPTRLSPTRNSGAEEALPFVSEGEFVPRRFDAGSGIPRLLQLFKEQRAVLICRDGELVRTVVAGDILDLCMAASEDTRESLEKTRLEEVIARCPDMVNDLEVSEDQSILEVIQRMRESSTHVVPIMSAPLTNESSPSNGGVVRRDSRDSMDSTEQEPGTLVGQFDISSLRGLFLKQVEADAGTWWWEDSSITTNVFSQTCMGFLALGPSSVVDDSAPYAAVLSSEPLARAISRAAATAYHSVVVCKAGDSARLGAHGPRSLGGSVSARALVVALHETCLFHSLIFDSSRTRRPRESRRVTLTAWDLQAVLSQRPPQNTSEAPARRTKVSWTNFVEMDTLALPMCVEHGMPFMRFSREEDPKNVMDFCCLKDGVPDAKVTNANARCLGCGRHIGRVSIRQNTAPVGTVGSGFPSSGGNSPDTAGGASGDKVCVPPAATLVPPSKGCLKAGTPGAGISMNTSAAMGSVLTNNKPRLRFPERRATSSPRGKKPGSVDDRPAKGASGGSSGSSVPQVEAASSVRSVDFFGFCCAAPCSSSGTRDQIASIVASKSSDYRRAQSGGVAPAPTTPCAAESAAADVGPTRSRRNSASGSPRTFGQQAAAAAAAATAAKSARA